MAAEKYIKLKDFELKDCLLFGQSLEESRGDIDGESHPNRNGAGLTIKKKGQMTEDEKGTTTL